MAHQTNIAAARAVDREFEYNFLAQTEGGGRRGGCAPHTPLLSGGLRPWEPPEGTPHPWLQRLVAFSRPSHLSGAAALPGADFFRESRRFFEEATCPGQLRCLGQNCLEKSDVFLKKPLVRGSFAAWGRTIPRTHPGQDPGSRILDPASWITDPWNQDPGSRILDPGAWIRDPGSRILDPGSWMTAPG